MIGLNSNCTRKGSILVVTLILLLVMTTMGVGLLYSTKKSAQQIGRSVDRVNSLYSAESCIVDAVKWLENAAKNGVPCKSGSCFKLHSKGLYFSGYLDFAIGDDDYGCWTFVFHQKKRPTDW